MENDRFCGLRSEASHEDSRIDFLIESAVDSIATGKFIDLMALIDQLHGVEPCMGRKVIASIESVASLGSNCQKVADGWMVRDLFAIYLGAVGEGGLQGFSDDWVELHAELLTGFTNMEM